MDDPAEALQICTHPLGIDRQLIHQLGKAGECEVQSKRSIGRKYPLHGGVADVPFVPKGNVFERWDDGSADNASEPCKVFAEHRVALVRHRARTLLAGMKELFYLAHFAPAQVPDLDR